MLTLDKANREELDCIYANFDHKLNQNVADQLKVQPGKTYAQHAAWGFCGYVWYQDGQWYEEIWIHNTRKTTRSNEDLRELIEEVNDHYGNE
jgi:hypothetical protein